MHTIRQSLTYIFSVIFLLAVGWTQSIQMEQGDAKDGQMLPQAVAGDAGFDALFEQIKECLKNDDRRAAKQLAEHLIGWPKTDALHPRQLYRAAQWFGQRQRQIPVALGLYERIMQDFPDSHGLSRRMRHMSGIN